MRNRSKKMLITAASTVATVAILGMGMEAHSVPARPLNGLTLDPAKRQAVAASTPAHVSMRRTKSASVPRVATTTSPSLIAAKLQRELSVEKTRGRAAGKIALLDDTQRRALHTLNATVQDAGGGACAFRCAQWDSRFSETPRTASGHQFSPPFFRSECAFVSLRRGATIPHGATRPSQAR